MIDIDIEEIIRAMQDRAVSITYYLNKETLDIVHVDENIAQELENEYEEEETVIEEWGEDFEDDDMYHEKIFSPTDDVDEKDLIKQIRYTNQDNYEPIPTFTLKEMKLLLDKFLATLNYSDPEILAPLKNEVDNTKTISDLDKVIHKYLDEKVKWFEYFNGTLTDKVQVWLKSLGYDFS